MFQTLPVTIGSQNVEQDFVLSNTWDGRSLNQVLNALAPATTPAAASASVPATTPATAPASQPVASNSPLMLGALPTFSGSWTSWQAQVD